MCGLLHNISSSLSTTYLTYSHIHVYICSGEWSVRGEGTPLLIFHDIILHLFDHVHWKVFFIRVKK